MESKASERGQIANPVTGEGHHGVPIQMSITVSQPKQLKVISYNCKNIETALWTFEALSKTTDIFLVQEHWLLIASYRNLLQCVKILLDVGSPWTQGILFCPSKCQGATGGQRFYGKRILTI